MSARRFTRFTHLGALFAAAASLLLAACQQNAADEDRTAPPARPVAAQSAPPARPGVLPAPGATPAPACSCDDEPVVDTTLLAFLSMARAAHHEADLAIEVNDRAKAVASLGRVVKSAWSGKKPPEMIEVQADTLARLADIESEDGRFDEASRDVDGGLAMATEPTHFRGRLFEVRGLVEERRAKALKDKGDADGAARARKGALDAFGQAMDIQEDVIGRAMKEKEREKRDEKHDK